MGVFDYIVGLPKIKCPECGAVVTGWQSKDGPCVLGNVHFSRTSNFYAHCDKCKQWLEFFSTSPDSWETPRPGVELHHYEVYMGGGDDRREVKLVWPNGEYDE